MYICAQRYRATGLDVYLQAVVQSKVLVAFASGYQQVASALCV